VECDGVTLQHEDVRSYKIKLPNLVDFFLTIFVPVKTLVQPVAFQRRKKQPRDM